MLNCNENKDFGYLFNYYFNEVIDQFDDSKSIKKCFELEIL